MVVSVDEAVSLDALPINYGFGGRNQQIIDIPEEEWTHVKAVFQPVPGTALEERWRVRWAVALLEQIAGRQTPIHLDEPLNQTPTPAVGQTDCVDESTNTTRFLRLMHAEGLLRFHDVKQPAFRAHFLLDAHNTATLRERETGVEFVVDSWFKANGAMPYVQALDDWFLKRPWPKEENPKVDPPALEALLESSGDAASPGLAMPIPSGS